MCDFVDESCGAFVDAGGMMGVCVERPTRCNAQERPVCGCDDMLYASPCAAAMAGQDVAFLAQCEPPSGSFACGFSFCISGQEYCLEQGGTMPTFDCLELPPVCQPPDCSCIPTCCECENATCCSNFCANEAGNLTYTCPGT